MPGRSLLMHLARLWTVAIVVGSFLPVKVKEVIGTETQSSIPVMKHRAAIRHKVGHLIAFGIAAFLFTAASTRKAHRLYYFLFVVALGSTIECMQHAIFGSALEWWDIRDDTLAAAVGCLLGLFFALSLSPDKKTVSAFLR